MPGGSQGLYNRLDLLCEEMHENDSLIGNALFIMNKVEELENEETLENA